MVPDNVMSTTDNYVLFGLQGKVESVKKNKLSTNLQSYHF